MSELTREKKTIIKTHRPHTSHEFKQLLFILRASYKGIFMFIDTMHIQ